MSQKRDQHFRPGFKAADIAKSKPVLIYEGCPRFSSKSLLGTPLPPLTVDEVMRRMWCKSRVNIDNAISLGQLPASRFDHSSGREYWHRLEFEAWAFWRHAKSIREEARASGTKPVFVRNRAPTRRMLAAVREEVSASVTSLDAVRDALRASVRKRSTGSVRERAEVTSSVSEAGKIFE